MSKSPKPATQKQIDATAKALKKLFKDMQVDDCWSAVIRALPCALETDNSGQYVIYTDCYEDGAGDADDAGEGPTDE